MTSINVFAPTRAHINQQIVLNDPSRFKLLRAGRKWRKTSLGISWLVERALLDTEGLTYPFILPYQTQARETVWNDHVKRMIHEFEDKGLPYNLLEQPMAIEFPGHGRLKLMGSDNEVALRSASNWGAMVGDEVDDWKRDVWDVTIRPNLMTHQAPAILMGTPKGKKNMWRLENMVNPQSGKPIFKSFHFTSFDNPDLPRAEIEAYANEQRERGNDWYEQEIMAEYRKPYGMVYKEWDETRQFKHIGYEPNLPLHISFDWGINDPTAVIWIQPDKYHGEWRIIDYYEASDANIEHFVSVIQSKPYKPAELYTGDPAGKARTLTTGTSVIEILQAKNIFVRTMDGVRVQDQIRVAHQYIPGVYVDSKCERFRDSMLNYRYPDVKEGARNQENELPIHDEYSHAMRAFEYWCVNTMHMFKAKSLNTSPIRSFDWWGKKLDAQKKKTNYVGGI